MSKHNQAAAFALTQRVGWTLINRLLDHFGSLDAILAASESDLRKVDGIGKKIAANIRAIDLNRTANDLERWTADGITAATWLDPDYPKPLHDLKDRPLIVFWKGTITPADRQSVAIVGTREPSAESLALAYEWGGAMAARGWTVISGMARGIDTMAHLGALKVHGRSLAVLGCGVNVPYPPENHELANRLIANGAILSEVAPDTPISASELAFRNRLITGLSRATIVIEAGMTSGAIYAAEDSYSQGRPVFAVNNSPGNAAMLAKYAHPLPADADILINCIIGSN